MKMMFVHGMFVCLKASDDVLTAEFRHRIGILPVSSSHTTLTR